MQIFREDDRRSIPTQGNLMNTIRMFAFIAAILITAVIFRVIADGLNDEPSIHLNDGPPIHVATEAGAGDHPAS